MRTFGRATFAAVLLCACGSRASTDREEIPELAAPAGARGGPAFAVTPMAMVDEPAPPEPARVAAPWTLTASDGSGLELVQVDARAAAEGPLAFTELHLYFHNPERRTREGTFTITLPPGAAVSRFAMVTDGKWQEAEIVERAVAQRAYDDFLHQRQDPALLEKSAGNQFSAKVFPIPARADEHLVVSFAQELLGRPYALPLRGLPRTARVDVSFAGTRLDGTPARETLSQRDWQPDRDFVATAAEPAAAVRSGALMVGAFEVAGGAAAPAEPPTAVTLLVDTSASRALGYAGYVQAVHGLVDAIRAEYGEAIPLQVVAFDQDTQTVFDGVAAGYGAAEDAALIARGAAGASDLAQAIGMLAGAATVHPRVIVVTDGVMTAGPETPALIAAIENLPIERLDVVLAGGYRDPQLAGAIVRTRLARAGDVYDLDRGAAAVAAGLGDPVLVDVPVEVPGAEWVYPTTIPAVRAGTSRMVYARLKAPARTVDVVIGGERRTIGLAEGTSALVERAVAGAEIAQLEDRLEVTEDPDAKKSLRADITARSVRSRVLSSQTSMIVLETEQDYARYGIERKALADILVVGPDGIETTHRTSIAAANKRRPRHARAATSTAPLTGSDPGPAEAGGASGGVLGAASAGYGVGSGRGAMRGRSASVPQVRIGQPTAAGDLDRATIRRYIRRYQAQITRCYEQELLARPTLEGTVTTSFAITDRGAVTGVTASGVDEAVAACIAGVLEGIEFPAVQGGGLVQVHYPFTFRRADAPAADAPAADAGVAAAPEAEPPAPEPTVAPEPAEPPAVTPAPPPAPVDAVEPDEDRGPPPLTGKLARVMKALHRKRLEQAYELAKGWHDGAPGDVLALVALGEALEAKRDLPAAARIYGSIIDLFPGRADLRRFAGERLERLGDATRPLVIDTYRRAVADRPDHASGHRLLAYALLRAGDHAGAFAAILAGVDRTYRDDGVDRVLDEDAGMIAASYLAHGGPKHEIRAALRKRSLALIRTRSTRFVMYWETDANDVDFHIRDREGGHAWYSSPTLPSGGELYADITTGYGPECFAIAGRPEAAPYRLSINYYSQGPMGYGMGTLQIQRFDGKDFVFDDRPFVVMTDHAFVDLGTYR